jgi:hypothetical protein
LEAQGHVLQHVDLALSARRHYREHPHLTAEQAALIFRQGEEAVAFALLPLAKQLAEDRPTAPTTPDPRRSLGADRTPPAATATAPARRP